MKKEFIKLLIISISFLCISANSQIIHNYGIKSGVSYSNQYWNTSNNNIPNKTGWEKYKTGFSCFIFCEKKVKNNFLIRPTIGYIQKGSVFRDEVTNIEGTKLYAKNILHELSLDVPIKINLSQSELTPYLFSGFRLDYFISYFGYVKEPDKSPLRFKNSIYDDFNKFTLGGIIGIGCSYKEIIFLELEFNPTLTRTLNYNLIRITDSNFDFTIGTNINKIIKLYKND